ncbi:MAG: septation regulator SpoVG [Spirochaetales bacterium]|nr:septation regulator SpoVG [Spirochaetales bacterium]
MEITDVRIKKVEANNKLKAFVSLTFDNCFVVHDLKIIKGKEGMFVAMPNQKTKSGEYKDIAHPITSNYRNILQTKILEEYEKLGSEEPIMAGAKIDSVN